MKNILSLVFISAFSFSVSAASPISDVGLFTIPTGEEHAGPAFPGKSFEFEVKVNPGEYFNFTAMYGVSNDWFFSSTSGIKLSNSLQDITHSIQIFDAGTEVDQNLENAPDIAPNQSGPNTGLPDRVGYVRSLSSFSSLEARNFIKVTSQPVGDCIYKIKITVLKSSATAVSPGVFWTTRTGYRPFIINRPQLKNGLEAQAEDGNPVNLFESIKAQITE